MTTQVDVQIRFADVDMLRHVNNVNLQHYFDLGKSDYFLKLFGFIQRGVGEELITASTATSYLEQTRYEDRIFVETAVERVGTKSFTMFQRLLNRDTGKVHAESRTVMVCYDFTRQVSIAVPAAWREKMQAAE